MTGVIGGRVRSAESRATPRPLAVTWLGSGELVVSDNVGLKGSPAALFRFLHGHLVELPTPPLRPGENTFAWSPNRKLIATQPWVSVGCGPGAVRGCTGTASGRTVFVERSDGSDRHPVAHGLLRGWTPDGRLLLFTGLNTEFAPGVFLTHDLRSGRRRAVLSSRHVAAFAHRRAEIGDLAYSADGRYLAARVVFGARSFGLWAVVIANANGQIIRLVRSTEVISMFVWSPRGHQLAYTTSGFPAPHELYLLSSPRADRCRILSQANHFDWVTWSPDNRWLLIDNEHQHAWELLRLTGHQQAGLLRGTAVPTRRLPRLGGMPLWCCPQQTYGGA